MARILSIYVDPDTCTCSEACVYECPEVLETQLALLASVKVPKNILKHTSSRSKPPPAFVRSRRYRSR